MAYNDTGLDLQLCVDRAARTRSVCVALGAVVVGRDTDDDSVDVYHADKGLPEAREEVPKG